MILSIFKEEVIAKVHSPINAEIKVVKFFGAKKIIVNGLIQTGSILSIIWQAGVKKAKKLGGKEPKKILILGLAGGTLAKILSRHYPQTKLVGIEIDPLMISLGKKYFDLNKIPNLKIICSDAIKAVDSLPLAVSSFDLIFVDLYLGDKIPEKAKKTAFLKNLKELLSPGGILVFNHLYYKQYKTEAEEFIKKIEKLFAKIELQHIHSNLLIFCSKQSESVV